MWIYKNSDGETIKGDRQTIAEYLNIHGDIYDDDFWDGVIKIHRLQEVE